MVFDSFRACKSMERLPGLGSFKRQPGNEGSIPSRLTLYALSQQDLLIALLFNFHENKRNSNEFLVFKKNESFSETGNS